MQPTESTVDAQVGTQVHEFRTARGWTQDELARRLGETLDKKIDPTTITRLEKGTRPLVLAELVALAAVFDMPVTALLPSDDAVRRQRDRGLVRRWQALADGIADNITEMRAIGAEYADVHGDTSRLALSNRRYTFGDDEIDDQVERLFASLAVIAGERAGSKRPARTRRPQR